MRPPRSSASRTPTTRAYVLIETRAGTTKTVRQALARMRPGRCRLVSLDAITGPFDYVAVIEGPGLDQIGRLVAGGIGVIEGVTRTTTCLVVAIE